MIESKLQQYKYHIGGGVLVIISLIAYYIYSTRGSGVSESENGDLVPDIQKLTELSDKTKEMSDNLAASQGIPTRDILEFRKLLKVFTHEMKKSTKSLIQFNTDRSSTHNYLNMRNNLFSKDIITTKLLIDSNNILDHSSSFNPSNFKVIFGKDKYPNTYKNVIGFRLLKCNIPISPYHIHIGDNHHNQLYKENGQPLGNAITPASYTGSSLAKNIYTALNDASVSISEVTFDRETLLFTFKFSTETKIDWSKSIVLARTLGFHTAVKTFAQNTPVSSDYVGDFNTTFVDLVIDEIPAIACKDNSKGQPVVDRIPLIQDSKGSHLSSYQANPSEYYTQNFFYPMKLSTLTIKLYLDHAADIIYDTQKGETNFEFELTILKNTKLMETTPQGDSTNIVYSSKST